MIRLDVSTREVPDLIDHAFWQLQWAGSSGQPTWFAGIAEPGAAPTGTVTEHYRVMLDDEPFYLEAVALDGASEWQSIQWRKGEFIERRGDQELRFAKHWVQEIAGYLDARWVTETPEYSGATHDAATGDALVEYSGAASSVAHLGPRLGMSDGNATFRIVFDPVDHRIKRAQKIVVNQVAHEITVRLGTPSA